MVKNLIQQLIPSFILKKYKQERFYRLIRDFKISQEPDLFIAQKLCASSQIVVDVGANFGLYSKFLSPFTCKVIAIEPVPFTFEILNKNMKRLNIKNIDFHNLAISNSIGDTRINIPIQAGVRNYFRASISDFKNDPESKYSISINTSTLDALCSQVEEKISLIKCDVEGHELQCVLGAEKLLLIHKPAWLIEVSGNPDQKESSAFDLFKFMKKNGYRSFWFDGKALIERRPGDSSVNYFFLSGEHLKLLYQQKVKIVEL